jgi:hypothetical protein
MANIKIEIDTNESRSSLLGSTMTAPAPAPLGILSTINLTQSLHDLFNDIERGYGTPRKAHHHNVERRFLGNRRDDLVSQGCKVLATVGGLYANSDIDGPNNVPFVSLVGEPPPTTTGSKCVGGVFLDSVNTNATRRQFLLDNKPGITSRALIGLYRHTPDAGAARTKVSMDEENEWNDAGTIFNSTGNYNQDLNGAAGVVVIPNTIKALIISASPYFLFQNNMTDLVKAANAWLAADTTRFVVFPLQIYSETSPQPHATATSGGIKRITLLGPDLHDACNMLGAAAKLAQGGGTPGWTQAPMKKSEM